MARHRTRNRFTFSRARHRAPGRVRRGVERGARTAIVALAAAALVISMVGSDPSFHGRN